MGEARMAVAVLKIVVYSVLLVVIIRRWRK